MTGSADEPLSYGPNARAACHVEISAMFLSLWRQSHHRRLQRPGIPSASECQRSAKTDPPALRQN